MPSIQLDMRLVCNDCCATLECVVASTRDTAVAFAVLPCASCRAIDREKHDDSVRELERELAVMDGKLEEARRGAE